MVVPSFRFSSPERLEFLATFLIASTSSAETIGLGQVFTGSGTNQFQYPIRILFGGKGKYLGLGQRETMKEVSFTP